MHFDIEYKQILNNLFYIIFIDLSNYNYTNYLPNSVYIWIAVNRRIVNIMQVR